MYASRHSWFSKSTGMTILALLAGFPVMAHAHERFINHTAKYPLHEDYFKSINPDMLSISLRILGIMSLMMAIWFLRDAIFDVVEERILPRLGLRQRDLVEGATAFVFDKPVRWPPFVSISEWVVVLFLRCPALVLMFSAANNSLVMPSYPLEPRTLFLFQIVQVIMSIGVLTQSLLPLGGATIFGTFLYLLWAYDWKIAIDILPVLTVAIVYISSPWDSARRAITSITPQQMRWVRMVLGFGFFALGWMKIYNYYLTVGVADNYPNVMDDPMIHIFWIGTRHAFRRENWVVGFAMAEVLTGFLLMLGVFCRVWCLMMVYVFTKLMIVDFGWAEIPHLYPIAAFLVVLFSNNLSSEFSGIERKAKYAIRDRQYDVALIRTLFIAIVLAALAIYPMLMLLTRVHHPSFQ